MNEQSRQNWIAIGKLAEAIRAMGATGDALAKLEDVKATVMDKLNEATEPSGETGGEK